MGTGTTRFEHFEQKIIFRCARVLPLVLSLIATVTLIGSVFAILYSFLPTTQPVKQPAPTDPAPISVNRAEVEEYLARPRDSQQEKGPPAAPTVSAEAKTLAEQLHAVRRRIDELGLLWADRYETVCTYRGSYTGECYSTERRRSAIGISSAIELALSSYNKSEDTESVVIDGTEYKVNPSRHEAKIAVLRELQVLLAEPAPADAQRTVIGWALLRREREEAREEERKRQESELIAKQDELDRAYSETVSRKQQARTLAVTGASFALGGFVILGLVLAVLAIERHTRELEKSRHAPNPSSPVTASAAAGLK